MKQFKISFQNPFDQNITNISYMNQEETVKSFLAIDWAKLNLECFNKEEEVLNNFYFFDIETTNNQGSKSNLTIAGQYTYGEQLEKSGPLFDVIYERPTEKKSRGFLGLGAEKTKIVSTPNHLPDCDQAFVIKCIMAFVTDDLRFLENEINHGMKHTFRRD
ncbi:MAG TPA: hypothetical protein VJ304_02950 [Flavobacterium sp.]|nr:hypothetical protein [Flavobacterium sp.]